MATAIVDQLEPTDSGLTVALRLSSGGYAQPFKLPDAGLLVLRWFRGAYQQQVPRDAVQLARGRRRFVRAGRNRLTLVATRRGLAAIRTSRSLVVTARAAFVIQGGGAVIVLRTFRIG